MDTLDFVRHYWQIIIACIALIAGYFRYENKVDNLQARMNATDRKLENMDTTFIQLQKDIVEIKTTLLFIKEKVR